MLPMRQPKVHTFNSTREAYDASECDSNIRDGDVLHVPPEGVAGVLYGVWPMAVTTDHGEFHVLDQPLPARYRASVDAALRVHG